MPTPVKLYVAAVIAAAVTTAGFSVPGNQVSRSRSSFCHLPRGGSRGLAVEAAAAGNQRHLLAELRVRADRLAALLPGGNAPVGWMCRRLAQSLYCLTKTRPTPVQILFNLANVDGKYRSVFLGRTRVLLGSAFRRVFRR